MLKGVPILLAVALWSGHAFCQSREETIAFIRSELTSLSNPQTEVREVEFSDNGRTCKLRVAHPGEMGGTALEFSLSQVDVFVCTKLIKGTKEESVFAYNLMVSPRRPASGIGREVLLLNALNGAQCHALAAAFAHLTGLVTDRKPLFRAGPVWP